MADLKKYYTKSLQRPLAEGHKFRNEFTDYLREDEQLLWSGKPKFGILFRSKDFIQVPFAAGWLYFMVSDLIMLEEGGFPNRIHPMLLLFVVVGLYMLIGRFIHEMIQRHYSYYAVTNQRVMVKSGIFSSQIQSTSLNSVASIQLIEKRSGQGSLTFETVGNLARISLLNNKANTQSAPLSFEKINEVRQVYGLITEAQSRLTPL
jgi:hypothetical protein